jgi:anti-sigma factor RsiW
MEAKHMADSEDVRFARLLDWVEGRLSEEEARAVERQVAADSATREEAAWLRAFARISEDTVIASPPPRVRETLTERFEAYAEGKRRPGLLKRLVATLTFDSGMQPALSWRSTAPELQREYVYSTEAADVTIDVRPRPRDGLLDIQGRIFAVNSTSPGPFHVQLLEGPSEVATTATNDLGEFTFEAVSPGVYGMIVSSERVEISIPQVELRRGS